MPCPQCGKPLGNEGLLVNLEDVLHRPKRMCRTCFVKWIKDEDKGKGLRTTNKLQGGKL